MFVGAVKRELHLWSRLPAPTIFNRSLSIPCQYTLWKEMSFISFRSPHKAAARIVLVTVNALLPCRAYTWWNWRSLASLQGYQQGHDTYKIRHCFWKLDNLMTIHNNYQDQVPISVFSSFQLQHIQDQVPIYVFPSFQLQHEVNDLVPNNRNPEAKYTHTAQHKISWFYYGCTKKSWITQPAFRIYRSLQINQDLAASQKKSN